MITTRRPGERFKVGDTEYIVEAVDKVEGCCKECAFDQEDGGCSCDPETAGFCYEGFRTDSKQVRFKKTER